MNCSRISSFVGAFSSRASLSFFHQHLFALKSGEHFGNSFTRAPAPGYPQPAPKLNYSFLLQPFPPSPSPNAMLMGSVATTSFFYTARRVSLANIAFWGRGRGLQQKL